MIMHTFDFCLQFCHLTLKPFFRLTPPPNLSTHRTEPTGVYLSPKTCF